MTPPGPRLPGPRLPGPVQSAMWLRDHPGVLERCHARYGDVFRLDMVARAVHGPGSVPGDASWVFLADPEDVRRVLTSPDAHAGATNRFLEGLVGPRSILVLDGDAHLARRRLMLPALHGDRVRGYAELMREVTEAEVARWPRDAVFPLWPRMQAITLEVIARTVFGTSDPRVQARLRDMLNRMTSPRWLAVYALVASLRGKQRARADRGTAARMLRPVEDVLHAEIARRRRDPDLEAREDVLSLLVRARHDDGSGLTDAELRDQLMTLLIAGHESTATSLAWAFERLVRHPEALARLRDEAETDEYADAVVKETLRLRPVVPMVLRRLAAPMRLGGHDLPEGTWVAPSAYLIHRRPDVYPDPARFRPQRFLERPAGTYTWLPFGGGVRRCLGATFAQLEMRVVLRTVLSRVALRAPDPAPEPLATRFITLAPRHGARVVVERPRPRTRAAAEEVAA